MDRLVAGIEPERAVLFFGSGSSIPSGAPTVAQLQAYFEHTYGVPASEYTLAEQAGIIENQTKDRNRLITELRTLFRGLVPTGAILNLPLYPWKSLYTTNYDKLIEASFGRKGISIASYSSNFDFGISRASDTVQLFKLHGTIDKDVIDGDHSRIILTENDYELTHEYRDMLYTRLASDLAGASLVIVGHSLKDPHIRAVVDRAVKANQKIGAGGRITLLMYNRDDGLATLHEAKGLNVCFGGLDDFFAGLISKIVGSPVPTTNTSDPLDSVPALRPATIDAASAASRHPDVSAMYNGWPATMADIAAGYTFRRNAADAICSAFDDPGVIVATILGPSGVGKTTAARQVLSSLMARDFRIWEHKQDQELLVSAWRTVARRLQIQKEYGVLLIDEAHADLPQINSLIDALSADTPQHLRLLLVSSKHHWSPRVKSPAYFRIAREFSFNRVDGDEIDRLLTLIEVSEPLRRLVEENFSGFSRVERRRRLVERCSADMFVCLKNIFSSDKLDDIILREYATLDEPSREIYRFVAALESAGVRVHRQLVIRLLGITAAYVASALLRLQDIIEEETQNEREGIYIWRGRHKVIMNIIAQHKYYDTEKRFDLFNKVIEGISPTYDIEIRTIRELCNIETGLATILDKKDQNVLLRKMMSIAPRERVPRHRLIRNLIDLEQFDPADAEIRIFENDFKPEGPVTRYKINLATERAVRSRGLLHEDRLVLIDKASEMAASAVRRFRSNKAILTAYCEVGLAAARLTGSSNIFDRAITEMKEAEERVGDPDISRLIASLEARMQSHAPEARPTEEVLDDEE
jgi:hypothetical protein